MKRPGDRLIRWTGFANVLNLFLSQLLLLVTGLLQSGYSPIGQPASDLGVGPYGVWFNGAAIVLSFIKIALAIAFLMVMRPIIRAGWRWTCAMLIALPGLGNITTAIFTEAPSTVAIHSSAAIVVQLSLLITFFLVGALLWRASGWHAFGLYSVIAGVLTVALVVLLYVTFAPTAALSALHLGGLAERLLILDRDVWYAVLGWLFFTRTPGKVSLHEPGQSARSDSGPVS